jgi:thymidylate synthase (FAD)
MKKAYDQTMHNIWKEYNKLLDLGIPAEDSRFILPNAACTNIIVSMNARSLLNFFELRCCMHAQWEIRQLANKMLQLVKKVAPMIFKNAGPICKTKNYCPENKKDCPLYPR